MNKFLCAFIPLLVAVGSAQFAASMYNDEGSRAGRELRSVREDQSIPEGNVNKYQINEVCRAALQNQIHLEMFASLSYQQMAAHFANNKIARKGFAKFFMHNSDEEREHAQKITDYVNRRGGIVTGLKIDMPHYNNWDSAKTALEAALDLENKVNNELHELHRKADTVCKDPQLMDFIEGTFLGEQVESIDNIQRLITQLNGMETGVGEYWVNRELLE